MKIASDKGFSLIELILYIAIISVLLVGVVQLNLIIKDSDLRFKSQRRINSNAQNFLNNVDTLVKNSKGFAEDNSGPCYDFSGAQGPSSYYLSLYYDTSTSATILPDQCVGKGNAVASTTAVKIYWSTSTERGIFLDCYQGFINQNSGNCTTIQGDGDATFRLTSAKGTIVYDGGLQFATSTIGGNTVLETSITIGIPQTLTSYQATTTASTSTAFKTHIQDDPSPTEEICGDGTVEGSEVCDSTITTACSEDAQYYSGGYVEDSSTCSGNYACKSDCSACLTEAACTGQVCGNGIKEGSETCDYTGAACPAVGYRTYYQSAVGCANPDDACKNDCSDCILITTCIGGI